MAGDGYNLAYLQYSEIDTITGTTGTDYAIVYRNGVPKKVTITNSGFGAGAIDDDSYFAGAIIIDDPNKIKDFNTELENVPNERFNDTIRSRKNGKHTPIILIQQRVFPNDLSGYLLDENSGLKFDH